MEKGIDWSKLDMFDGIGRTDLKEQMDIVALTEWLESDESATIKLVVECECNDCYD